MTQRSLFREWGLGLDGVDFACALAALGVGQAKHRVLFPHATEYNQNDLVDALQTADQPVEWALFEFPETLAEQYLHPLSALNMAAAWKQAVARQRAEGGWTWQLRLQVEMNLYVEPLLPWLLEALALPAVGADSVFLWDGESGPRVHWHWPVRVGYLDNPGSQHLGGLEFSRFGYNLVEKVRMPEAGEQCDLLLLPGSLRQSVLEVLARPEPLRASCIAVLGGMESGWTESHLQKALLLERLGAAGIYIANVPVEEQVADWFYGLVTELSHNLPLDVCFHHANRKVAGDRPLPYLFYGTPRLIEDSRLAAQAAILGYRIANLETHRETIEIPPESGDILGLSYGFLGKTLSEKLLERIPYFGFDAERREATGLAMISGAITQTEQQWARTKAKPRWIQAQVFERLPSGDQPVRQALMAEMPHALDVRIGPEDIEWLMPPPSEPFPDWELPEDPNGHDLTVVFSEPHHVPEPQVAQIFLPPSGESSICRFYFQPKSNQPSFQARIMVLHGNRILQTARLTAQVVAEPTEIDESQLLRLAIESVLRPNLVDLEDRRVFDAAMITNHHSDGDPALVAVSGEQARLSTLTGLEQVIDNIRNKLEEIALNPEDFSGGLFSTVTEDLLRYLAIQGSSLYKGLVRDQLHISSLAQSIGRPLRLQVVSALPESFLPLEFVYAKPAPDRTARICPQAVACLQAGKPQDCGMDPQVPNPLICPLGFWGLYHVIERHVTPPPGDGKLQSQEFDLRSFPYNGRNTLDPLAGAVYAASNRVDKFKQGQIQSLLGVLRTTMGDQVRLVETWQEWLLQVAALGPALLVLLPHTFRDQVYDDNGMEIGEAEQLMNTYFTPDYVHSQASEVRPVVFLFGCETMSAEIPFQSFIAEFRRNHAAVVVGTAASVLGRHAGVVAEKAIHLLEAMLKQGAFTFGEVMLRLRCQALADGLPMVLTLFAYGDADWTLSATAPGGG